MSSSRKNPGLGSMLLIGAASAVVGGIVAYRRHKQIEEIVESFHVTLDGDDFEEFEEESIVHTVSDNSEEEAEGEPEEDFVPEPTEQEDSVSEAAKEDSDAETDEEEKPVE